MELYVYFNSMCFVCETEECLAEAETCRL